MILLCLVCMLFSLTGFHQCSGEDNVPYHSSPHCTKKPSTSGVISLLSFSSPYFEGCNPVAASLCRSSTIFLLCSPTFPLLFFFSYCAHPSAEHTASCTTMSSTSNKGIDRKKKKKAEAGNASVSST
jgi:hypothetical protein